MMTDDKILDEMERIGRMLLNFAEGCRLSEIRTPKSHKNPPGTQFPLSDLMEEVLNKCVGRKYPEPHPKKPFLISLAGQIPSYIVYQAMDVLQQRRMTNLDPDKPDYKLEPYFFATLRNMCKSNFIKTTIQWHFD